MFGQPSKRRLTSYFDQMGTSDEEENLERERVKRNGPVRREAIGGVGLGFKT